MHKGGRQAGADSNTLREREEAKICLGCRLHDCMPHSSGCALSRYRREKRERQCACDGVTRRRGKRGSPKRTALYRPGEKEACAVYDSMTEACAAVGVSRDAVRWAMQKGKPCHGYEWRTMDDFDNAIATR